MLAAARKELDGSPTLAPNNTSTTTGPALRAAAVTAAAVVVNAPPVLDSPTFQPADPTTGAVTGQIVAADPEHKTLSYTLTSSPSEGKLVLDKKTGIFTYTPTAAQRVRAQVTAGEQTVQFSATVSDGTKTNIVDTTVTVTVNPTTIADVGEVAAGQGATWVAVTNTRAYVANADSHSITVIDTVNRTKIKDIALAYAPVQVTVAPDGKRVYVVDDTTSKITVIDATTNQLGAAIDFGASRYPNLLTLSPDGKTLYATGALLDAKTGHWSPVITKVTTATGKISGTVKLSGATTDFYDITVAPDGKKIYVIAGIPAADPDAEFNRSGVFVFASNATSATLIGSADYLSGVTVSPDGSRLYIADKINGEVAIQETKTYQVLNMLSVGGAPSDVQVNGDGSLLMVFDDTSGAIKVYDTRSPNYDLVTTVPTNATFVDYLPQASLSPDGMELYFNSDTGLQIVSLVPANSRPFAGNPFMGSPNATTGAVTGAVGVTDSDDDVLKYVTTSPPTKGALVVNANGSFTYTPTAAARHAAAATGATSALTMDTFTLTVSDGRRGVVTQTITVNILPANQAPTIKTSTSSPNSTSGAVTGSVTGTDRDKDGLTYTADARSAKGGTVTVDAKGKFTYVPTAAARHAASASGAGTPDKTDTFTVRVSDGHGSVKDVTVNVIVSPKNAKPANAAYSLGSPNTGSGTLTGAVTATDADSDNFTLAGPSTTKKGSLTYDSATDSFTYTPTSAARTAASAPNASASAKTDSFTVTVSDGHGGTATVAVKLTISVIGNQNPTGGRFTAGTPNAVTGAIAGTVTAADPDANPLTYIGSQTTSKGTVTVSASGAFTFTPTVTARHAAATMGAGAALTTDTFTVTASDGRGGTLPVTVTVDVLPKNAAPITNIALGQPNSLNGAVIGTVSATDPDGDPLTYGVPVTTTKGIVTVNANGTFTYTPTVAARDAAAAPGATATAKQDTFTVTVTDGHSGGTVTKSVTVDIAPRANQAPTNGGFNTGQASATTGVVTGTVTASDPNGDKLTYGLVSGSLGSGLGDVVVDANTGAWAFRPSVQARYAAWTTPAAGSVQFAIVASDGLTTTTISVTAPVDSAVDVTTSVIADGHVHGPLGVTVDSDGKLWVANDLDHTVSVFGANGSWLEDVDVNVGGHAVASASNVTAGPDGRMYVTVDVGDIDEETADTVELVAIGPAGAGGVRPVNVITHLPTGSMIAVGGDGLVYVAMDTDPVLAVLGAAGTQVGSIDLKAPPTAIGFGPNGNLYVAYEAAAYDDDARSAGTVVSMMTTQGAELGTFRSGSTTLLGGFDIDDAGRMYLASQADNSVVVLGANGTVESVIHVDRMPFGVSVGTDGRLYVANNWDDAVSVLTPIPVQTSNGATSVNQQSGAVTGQVTVLAPIDVTYALAAQPDPAIGVVRVSPTTGIWSFTPTARARYGAWTSPGADTVSFSIVASNGQSVPVTATIDPAVGFNGSVLSDQHVYAPAGVAVDADGKLWVTNYFSHTVSIFDRQGTWLEDVDVNVANHEVANPWDIAVGPDGRVYVAVDYGDVDDTTIEGGELVVVGSDANGDGQRDATVLVTLPSIDALAVSGDGRVYVAGADDQNRSTINVFNSAGTQISSIEFDARMLGLDVGTNGRLYGAYLVKDGDGNPDGAAIVMFDSNGARLATAYPTGNLDPAGLAVDSSGRVYVTDRANGAITISTFDGSVDEVIGVGASPTGVTVGTDGKIYVANYWDGTISVLTPAPLAPYGYTVDAFTGLTSGSVKPVNTGANPTFALTSSIDPAIGVVLVNPQTGTWVLKPTAQARFNAATGHAGTLTFTISVSVGTDSSSITVDAPIAADPGVGGVPTTGQYYGYYDVASNSAIVSGYLEPFGSALGNAVTYSVATPLDPTLGEVVVDPVTGAWQYAPSPLARATAAGTSLGDYATIRFTAAVEGQYSWTFNVDAPILAGYNETQTSVIPVNGIQPVGIAVDGAGRIYVTGGRVYTPGVGLNGLSGSSITVVNPDGTTADVIALSGGTAVDVVIGPDGRLYVTDMESGTISAVNPTTHAVQTIASVAGATGLAFDDNGRLYVTGVIAEASSTLTIIGPGGSLAPIAISGQALGVAVGGDGRIYVSSRDASGTHGLLTVLRKDGTVIKTIMLEGSDPLGVAVAANGMVYVTDTTSASVLVVDPNVGRIGAISVGQSPADLTFGDDGRIYVTNFEDGTVSVLSAPLADGETIPSPDDDDQAAVVGVGFTPTGAAVDADGRVFVIGIDADGRAVVTVLNSNGTVAVSSAKLGTLPSRYTQLHATFGADGKLYVIDQAGHLSVVDPNHTYASGDGVTIGYPTTRLDSVPADGATAITSGPDGRLYIVRKVDTADESGSPAAELIVIDVSNPLSAGVLDLGGVTPTGVAVGTDGLIYVSSFVTDQASVPSGRVTIYHADGTVANTIQLGAALPSGMSIGSDGVIYVTDRFNATLVAIDPDGVRNIPLDDLPTAVTVGADGRIFVVNGLDAGITVLTAASAGNDPTPGEPIVHVDYDRLTWAGSEDVVRGHVDVIFPGNSAPVTYQAGLLLNPELGYIAFDPETNEWSFYPSQAARLHAGTNFGSTESVSFTIVAVAGNQTKTILVLAPIAPETLPQVGSPPFTVATTNGLYGYVSGQVNVYDMDGDTLSYTVSTPPPSAVGDVGVGSYGTFTFYPTRQARLNAWYSPGEDTVSFTITATDGLATQSVNVTLTIAPLAPTPTDHLSAGQQLDPRHYLQSANGRYRLYMQTDGNLVLYDEAQNHKAVWAIDKFGANNRAVMQADGNLVVYSGSNALWSSRTDGKTGAQLVLQDDGNLVIKQGSTVVWDRKAGVVRPVQPPVTPTPVPEPVLVVAPRPTATTPSGPKPDLSISSFTAQLWNEVNNAENFKKSDLYIKTVSGADGKKRIIVFFAGTRDNFWSTVANAPAYAGIVNPIQVDAIRRAALGAVSWNNLFPEIMLVGHSQGGMHAQNIAFASNIDPTLNITTVVTFGSPIVQNDSPIGKYKTIHLQAEEDAVPSITKLGVSNTSIFRAKSGFASANVSASQLANGSFNGIIELITAAAKAPAHVGYVPVSNAFARSTDKRYEAVKANMVKFKWPGAK